MIYADRHRRPAATFTDRVSK